jgi:DNA-binding CsgD family transcriptional regulator
MSTVTVNYPHFNIPPSSARLNSAVEQLSRIQTELISDALRRSVDDAGAAMKRELSEPLTALLLYLHEIKRVGEVDATGSALATWRVIVDGALCEIDRVCNIIDQVGKAVEDSADADVAITRGRDAVEAWASDNGVRASAIGSFVPHVNTRPLTPREQEVLALITGGCSNKEGSYRLGISTRTFEAHRARLMAKLGARNAADLIRKASNQKSMTFNPPIGADASSG